MRNKPNFQKATLSLAIAALSTSSAFASANFIISPTPGLPIPSTISTGQTVRAYYTITNQTSTTRIGYMIQGLPASVHQNASNAEYCPTYITLAPHASCIVQLDITAPVQSNFAICKGASCTTSATPLNVVAGGGGVTYIPMVAAGSYLNTSNFTYPLLATSTNGGSTWVYTIDSSTSPSVPNGYFQSATFSSADCSGVNCVSVGQFANSLALGANPAISYPLIANSNDGGIHWRYVDTGIVVPEGGSSGFASTSCSGLNCVAAGNFNNATLTYPLLAASHNGGITWSYRINNFTPGLPSDFSSGSFVTSDCSGLYCVAAGSYESSDIGAHVIYPLLAASADGGTNWSYRIYKNTPGLPSNFAIAEGFANGINGVSCSGLNCVAVGQYQTTEPGAPVPVYPLLATSSTGGQTWVYNSNTSYDLSVPTDYGNYASFKSVSCSGLICVARGYYDNSASLGYPLLATSTNGGMSWAYTLTSNSPTLPADYLAVGVSEGAALFNSVSCSGLNCVAAGQYRSSDAGNPTHPLLATSSNGGQSWVYTLSGTTTPSVPNDYLNFGTFLSVDCNGLHCLAAGQYNSTDATTPRYPLLAVSFNGGKTWTYYVNGNGSPFIPDDLQTNGVFNSVSANKPSFLPDSLKFLNQQA